ncbi:hypothetical protein GQ600_26949 [Phytophthora cactorum]|nr:hypothetical protein GQ600_26949 [Phytophthora cactorum]
MATVLEIFPRHLDGYLSTHVLERVRHESCSAEPIEWFHRELNKRFKPHPAMKQFVTTLEILAREYVVQRNTVLLFHLSEQDSSCQKHLIFPMATSEEKIR